MPSELTALLLAALLPSASVREMPPEEAFGPVISCQAAHERMLGGRDERLFFKLNGQVIGVLDARSFTLSDGTTPAFFMNSCEASVRRGDRVTIRCTALPHPERPLLFLEALDIAVVSHHPPAPPPVVAPTDIQGGRYDFRQVELAGILTDVFRDDADPAWLVLTVEEENVPALVWYKCDSAEDERFARLIDARIALEGVSFPRALGMRRNLGQHLQATAPARLRVLEPVPGNPFDGPVRDGHRQPCHGTVTAVWNERSLFIRDTGGDSFEVSLALGQVAPPPGTPVDVAAFSRSNAFYVRYANALIRPRPGAEPVPPEAPTAVSARDILRNARGQLRIDARRHGSLIRLRGKVRDGYLLGTPQAQLLLDSDGEPVTVWIGTAPAAPAPGSTVEVTGACIIDVEAGVSGRNDVRLSGFSVALRSPDELVVLARPPWWTPARLMATIAVLFLLLAAILVWNRMLRRTVERRGRALLRATIQSAEADLRTEERTRLAVELHDTIAQSLTGVTFELNTAARLVELDRAKAKLHLDIADRTLKSCRDELRNCIWDLRGDALGQPDLNEAIRQALKPHLGGAAVQVRFNVPRARLSDNTVHALLRIIRELALNAVRHGRATLIRVAGSIDAETLRFSVRDDGAGFDPASAPGVLQGHFGLQGIRERVNRFGGTLEIDSAPGRGTRVEIAIATPAGRKGEA